MAFSVNGITYGSLIKDHAHMGRVVELPEDSYGSYTIRTTRGNLFTVAGYNAEICNWHGLLLTGDMLLVTDGTLRVVVTVAEILNENEIVAKAAGMRRLVFKIHRSQIIGRMDELRNHKFTLYTK